MVLICNSNNRADQNKTGKGHLEPHLRGRRALTDQQSIARQTITPQIVYLQIKALMQTLAHQRRKLHRLFGIVLLFELFIAGMAKRTRAQVAGDIRANIIVLAGFEEIRNFK